MTPITYPRIPLKMMDAASLVFELSREVSRVVENEDHRAVVNAAAMLATHLHRHQTRRVRGGMPRVPYIEHPIRNALRLIRFGKTDYRLIAAALLHDVLEDCSDEIATTIGSALQLREGMSATSARGRRAIAELWMQEHFGTDITSIVKKVSHDVDQAASEYAAGVDKLAADMLVGPTPPYADDAGLVKAVDLIDNAGSLRHQLAAGDDPEVVHRLAKKYAPGVASIGAAMRAIGEHEIADALQTLESHLYDILN